MANNEKIVRLIEFHGGQQKVVDNAKRINTLNCGRRFGKNELGKVLMFESAIGDGKAGSKGSPVAWFEPTYKSLTEVWKEVKEMLQYVIREKSEQTKQIILVNGGIIDFWSLDNPDSGRGRKYKRIIVNECAMIKNLKVVWFQTLRPMLADLKGDAWLMSTPKGKNSDWYDLCQKVDIDWAHFQLPTSANPLIDKDELKSIKRETPHLDYLQEYEAQFVDFLKEAFFYEFSSEKHIVDYDLEVDRDLPLILAFDFNNNPVSLVAGQMTDRGLNIIEEIQANGGTENLLEKLHWIKDGEYDLQICGDNSGWKGVSSSRYTDFQLIEDFFGVDVESVTHKANRLHVESRVICNTVFRNLPLFISREKCSGLIREIMTAEPTANGKLKKDDGRNRNDLVDAFRYMCHFLFDDLRDIVRTANSIEDLEDRNIELVQQYEAEQERTLKRSPMRFKVNKNE